jgi:hypothetical protein
MPYILRKRIRELYIRPLVLEVVLDNDKFIRHFNLDDSFPKVIRATVNLLVDQNDCIMCFTNNNKIYDFEVYIKNGPYNYNSTEYSCHRSLILPRELVNGYAIDANWGIELTLNELIVKGDSVGMPDEHSLIFSENDVKSSMDFEVKGLSCELTSSEKLVTTQFIDDFYNDLKLEINNAFRIKLLTSTMVLVRKLFENLLIELLRAKFGDKPPGKELYFSIRDSRFKHFHVLINNFENEIDAFKPFDVNLQWDASKNDFFDFLRVIKERGDACAHSIEPIHDVKEINTLKVSINKYSAQLNRLIQNIKESKLTSSLP